MPAAPENRPDWSGWLDAMRDNDKLRQQLTAATARAEAAETASRIAQANADEAHANALDAQTRVAELESDAERLAEACRFADDEIVRLAEVYQDIARIGIIRYRIRAALAAHDAAKT